MGKTFKFGKIGFIIGCIGNAGLNVVIQVRSMHSDLQIKFDWNAFLKLP